MTFTVESEREDDGRWLAEVLELPGVLAYGQTSDEAIAKAQAQGRFTKSHEKSRNAKPDQINSPACTQKRSVQPESALGRRRAD